MKLSDKIFLKVYGAVIGTATTVGVQKLLNASWEFVTGDEPPEAGDPDVPPAAAFSWVLASAIGVAVSQLAVQRLTARQALKRGGEAKPKHLQIRI